MRKLAVITLIYIAFPSLLFLIIWLNPYLSALAVGGMGVAIALALKDVGQQDLVPQTAWWPIIGASVLVALLVCSASEFGLFSYQSYDYLAHNYKFNLLATQHLPLYDPKKGVYMCYYLGSYLVPSLLGRMTSLSLVKFYFFLWSWLGISLAFIWIHIKLIDLSLKKRVMISVALIGGAYVCILLPSFARYFPSLTFIQNNGFELSQHFVLNQVPVFTRNLSESPQHTIPAILGAAFMLAVLSRSDYYCSLLFFYFATMFLAPFTVVGLSGFMLVGFIVHWKKLGWVFLKKLLVLSVPLLLSFMPVVLFLLSSQATQMSSNKAIWQADPHWFYFYVLYLFGFVGIWFLFLKDKLFELDRMATTTALVSQMVLSLFQIGYFNDLNIRSAIVLQLVIGLSITYVLVVNYRLLFKNVGYTLGLLFFILNLGGPMKFYYERIFQIRNGAANSIEQPIVSGLPNNYYDLLEKAYRANGKEVIKQYSLKEGSVFERYLLKKNS